MRRFAVPAVITAAAVILLIVLAIGISGSGPNDSLASQVGLHHTPKAPGAAVNLAPVGATAQHSDLAAYRGKLVLVNFFAGWCGPCASEAPLLRQSEKMLTAHDGTVVGLTYRDSPSDAASYLHRYDLRYPSYFDANGTVADDFGVTGPPENYLINRQGKVVWLTIDPITSQFVKTTLPKLIAENS